jgi:protein ImuB
VLPCRIACVRIGRFATGALGGQATASAGALGASAPPSPTGPLRPDQPPADSPPVALVADVRGKPRVIATDAAAARRGVRPGMAFAEARALAADLVALPWDTERVARAALEVTTALLAASPRVAWAGGPSVRRYAGTQVRLAGSGGEVGIWWVDAAGLGGEPKLAQRLCRIANALRFGRARAGVADSAIAAYAAAVSGHRGTGAQGHRRAGTPVRRYAGTLVRPVIVPPGDDAQFLAPFPLALLAPPDDLAETCHALGLGTVGQFAALDADEVEARFGPEGLAAHRLARGFDTRGPTTPRDDALPVIACNLGSPVASAEPLLFVLKAGLASLGSALRAKGLAARELALTLTLDDGSTAEKTVRLARPTSHEGALFDHCRAAFEDWKLAEPVTALAVRAAVAVPASGEQGELLAPRWADPAALEAAFDRIRGSEGVDAVAQPLVRDGHLPRDGGAWRTEELVASGEQTATAPTRAPAPTLTLGAPPNRAAAAALRLLQVPTPARVRLGRSGLEAFRHGETWHDVTDWSGPERLAPRWWIGESAGAGGASLPAGSRDYYSARTAAGTLWLLFRAGASRQWFVEGWWD